MIHWYVVCLLLNTLIFLNVFRQSILRYDIRVLFGLIVLGLKKLSEGLFDFLKLQDFTTCVFFNKLNMNED